MVTGGDTCYFIRKRRMTEMELYWLTERLIRVECPVPKGLIAAVGAQGKKSVWFMGSSQKLLTQQAADIWTCEAFRYLWKKKTAIGSGPLPMNLYSEFVEILDPKTYLPAADGACLLEAIVQLLELELLPNKKQKEEPLDEEDDDEN